MRAYKFFLDPMFLIGLPALILGLVYNQPVLMGLGLSLLSCALISV